MTETPGVSHLLNLQPELLLEIVSHLQATPSWQNSSQKNLMNWSSVCKHFRSFLAPYAFTPITLCNTEKSGASVDLIAKSEYRHYVREFRFQGTAPGDEEEGFGDVDGIFPLVVENILSNLSRFPALETVCVNFPMEFDDGWEESFMLFQDSGSPEERIKLERTEAWRALNTKTYAALASNANPAFRHLVLKELIPAEASSMSTPQFQQLLGHMTRFDLSCWEDQSDSHYHARTRGGYYLYVRSFGNLFFNHLASITHLNIEGDFIPIGLSGASAMGSQLQSFSIDSIFITPDLKDFLVRHAKTLEVLNFRDCHAGGDPGYGYISWADFLFPLLASKPTRLREFSVTPDQGMELFNDYHSTQAIKDEAALASEFLKTHPERRLFSHAYVDDKYGFVGDSQEGNLVSFRLGNDQRAYDGLMRIVEKNCLEL